MTPRILTSNPPGKGVKPKGEIMSLRSFRLFGYRIQFNFTFSFGRPVHARYGFQSSPVNDLKVTNSCGYPGSNSLKELLNALPDVAHREVSYRKEDTYVDLYDFDLCRSVCYRVVMYEGKEITLVEVIRQSPTIFNV